MAKRWESILGSDEFIEQFRQRRLGPGQQLPHRAALADAQDRAHLILVCPALIHPRYHGEARRLSAQPLEFGVTEQLAVDLQQRAADVAVLPRLAIVGRDLVGLAARGKE